MSNIDFGASKTGTPIGATNAPVPSLPGTQPATGALPVIPGPDFPIPTPVITEGDPAQFVNSAGQTQQQVKDAAAKASLEATQTAIAIAKNNHLAELLKDEVFSDAYYQIVSQRDLHAHLSDASLNPGSTPWHRSMHGVLAVKLAALVDLLQELPA